MEDSFAIIYLIIIIIITFITLVDKIPPSNVNKVPIFHLLVVSALSPAVVHRYVSGQLIQLKLKTKII